MEEKVKGWPEPFKTMDEEARKKDLEAFVREGHDLGQDETAKKKRLDNFMDAFLGKVKEVRAMVKKGEPIKTEEIKEMKQKLEKLESFVELREGDFSTYSTDSYKALYTDLAERNGFPPKAAVLFQNFFEGGISQDTLCKELIELVR